MLGLAKRTRARIFQASTSEVYGDPADHSQPESYWGHVNPIGIRSCYDEGKRVAETLTYGFHRQDGVDVRVARIFNTYGKLIFIPVLEEPESLTLLHRTSQYVSPRRSNPGATGSPITHH